jgi:hypothetical protein
MSLAPTTIPDKEVDDELLKKLADLWMFPIEESEDGNDQSGESSTWASTRKRESSLKQHRFGGCMEDKNFLEVVRVTCKHEYSQECIRGLFKASLTDEQLFPARCCKQPMAMSSIRIFLISDLVQQYEAKKVEFGTKDKIYCHAPTCSAFIHPSKIQNDRTTCPECNLATCTICKFDAHAGDCPADVGLQQVLATAAEDGSAASAVEEW